MTEKHTPGPWEASAAHAIWAISPWNARVCLASVTTFSAMNGIDAAANARLIAASPDLLEALRDMVDWLDDGNRQLSDEAAADVAKARAAIDRATGAA